MKILFLLFIVTPIIEMWLLITVGGVIGALPTIGLVLLTACIGMGLLRYQGLSTLQNARMKMQNNELPAREIADSLFFALGGALLLTPGFVTDAIGFACLTPGIRTIFIHYLGPKILGSVSLQANTFTSSNGNPDQNNSNSGKNVIDGEYERKDD